MEVWAWHFERARGQHRGAAPKHGLSHDAAADSMRPRWSWITAAAAPPAYQVQMNAAVLSISMNIKPGT